jgi:hypothetical protein
MRVIGIISRLWNFTRDYLILVTLLSLFIWTIIEVYGFGVGPMIQLPPEGYLIENLEARLQWHNGNRPQGYTLQISEDDPSFQGKFFLEKAVTGTTYNINDLEPGHTYYWRLTSKDNRVSKTASFKTAPNAINFQ